MKHKQNKDKQVIVTQTGLTKREYFAGLAMQGILAANYFNDDVGHAAVAFADELLEALELEEDDK